MERCDGSKLLVRLELSHKPTMAFLQHDGTRRMVQEYKQRERLT